MQFYPQFVSQYVEMERTCQEKFAMMEMSLTPQIVNQIVLDLSLDICALEAVLQLLELANKFVETQ